MRRTPARVYYHDYVTNVINYTIFRLRYTIYIYHVYCACYLNAHLLPVFSTLVIHTHAHPNITVFIYIFFVRLCEITTDKTEPTNKEGCAKTVYTAVYRTEDSCEFDTGEIIRLLSLFVFVNHIWNFLFSSFFFFCFCTGIGDAFLFYTILALIASNRK